LDEYITVFTMKLLKNKPLTIFGNGTQIRDFTHVNDVAEATILAAEKQSTIGKTINIGTGKPTTIQQLANIIMNTTNTKTPLQYKPKPKGDPHGGYAETTQMKNTALTK